MKEHFCSAEKSMITYEGSCNWCGESEGSMTQDDVIEMARQAGFFVKDNDAYSPSVQEDHELTPFLVAFAHLVADKATEEANAKANASWTLMCKKMVAIERESCANLVEESSLPDTYSQECLPDIANEIRARGEQA
jgi:hypothetical protein